MEVPVDFAAVLLLIAAVVAIATRRLHLPYAAGLVAAGMALAAAPFTPSIGLTKDLLFNALLPPLVFEAALRIPWNDLRRDWGVITLLATAGLLLSAALTAVGMHFVTRWEWESSVLFGILIAATDPVSVIAIFREAGARGRMLLLVEAESLFNDGTAAVAFSIAMAVGAGADVRAASVATMVVVMIGGGILAGAAVAALALLLAGRTEDHLVEITVTTVAAYGSFLLADHFNLSGVLAALTAGLILGNSGEGVISAHGRETVNAFWEYAAFVANSLIFLLMGLRVASSHVLAFWFAAASAIVLVTFSRALAIYPCSAFFAYSRWRVPLRQQHILFWGGLRGALALALALALPARIPGREEVIAVSFAVAAFSILVQGLTMRPLLRRLGEASSVRPLEPAEQADRLA